MKTAIISIGGSKFVVGDVVSQGNVVSFHVGQSAAEEMKTSLTDLGIKFATTKSFSGTVLFYNVRM